MSNREQNYNQFIRNFKENNSVQKYFSSRNLSNKLLEKNLVGYCPVFSSYEFPLLRGRLIVPIRDVHGNIIAMAGRQVPDLTENTIASFWETHGNEPAKCLERISKWKKGKWINEPYQRNKNLFFLDQAKDAARKQNYIVLVEGYFDVYSFYSNGFENVSALCGTSISDYQVALCSRYCDNIVLILDGDEPGRIAGEKIYKKIHELGINCLIIYLPDKMDPDDFALSFDLEALDLAIKDSLENKRRILKIKVS
jgi:DNA primase